MIFQASRDAGGSGIYIQLSSAPGPVAVLRTGDLLFGSSVSTFNVDGSGLADGSSTFAFRYTLANGVSGVARADISAAAAAPEPSALARLIPAVPLAGMIIRRRQRKA